MAMPLASLLIRQKNRFIQAETPLGEHTLLLDSLEGFEFVSAPFHFDLTFLPEKGDLELKSLIGKVQFGNPRRQAPRRADRGVDPPMWTQRRPSIGPADGFPYG